MPFPPSDLQNVYESDYNYQYNGDLYTIYASLTDNEQKQDAMNAIEKISKGYQPNITSGFDVNHFRLIRALGQGMNGSVSRSLLFSQIRPWIYDSHCNE
jgi:hypothetical protein